MLWTIIPVETVMAGLDNFQPQYKELTWKNKTLLVEPQGMAEAKVIRIISSDPLDYLNPQLQPGQIIKLKENQPVF
ncbi:MAG: hypothetical protein GX922_07085 [Firmicutes bacterium]|nr:hypothetical protein [Bacillota bacterium]